MKFILCFVSGLILFFVSAAQNLQEVKGLPTKELYDLHVDKKGYLWIAHDLGISRFDGVNFIHFSNPAQASLSITDIFEDNQGRIWCHNSSGQIFYIEKGQMQLLEAYNYANEIQFTRIAICGDELIATSDKGLFVCSTIDLKSKYLPINASKNKGMLSLAVIAKRTILFDGNNWFLYEKGRISNLYIANNISVVATNSLTLQPVTYGNLFFLISNPSGLVQKLTIKSDSLLLVSKYETNDFINAVSVSEQPWIHTRNESATLDGKWKIKGQGLTDAIKDKEGNTWFSSSKNGLLVHFKKSQWQLLRSLKDKDDFVRCLNVADGYFFAGTNKGNLVIFDSTFRKILWEQRLFDGYGSIEFIRFYKNHRFVVGTTVNTFIVNPIEKKVEDLLPLTSVQDVDFDKNTLYLSTVKGVYMIPYLDSVSLSEWLQLKQKQFPFLKDKLQSGNIFLLAPARSNAIRFDNNMASLFVSFKNGLHQINEKGIQPVFVNGKEVFASSLWYKHPQLFMGTFSDGLMIKRGNRFKHITTKDFLSSNTILRTKATQKHLWLFENDAMQVLDLQTENLQKNVDLPPINGANVFDIAEWGDYGFITTSDGVYKIPMNSKSDNIQPTAFLDAVIVNNNDTLAVENSTLSYNSNDLQFVFSSPIFFDPMSVFFRYRLNGAQSEWQTTRPGERRLRYPSLTPGNYLFEAYPVNNSGLAEQQMISFKFSIINPWWKQWWFYGLIFLFIIGLIYILEKYRVQQLLKVERVRRNISSDLHDDIGATLSSINLYTELAKKEVNNTGYLITIQQHATEVIDKLDDLIWSINPKNDNFEQLVNRMYSYADALLHAKKIHCTFEYDKSLLQEKLPVQIKQNLFLIFKELINNVVKHSHAKTCKVEIACHDFTVFFSAADDGMGFNVNEKSCAGNGIANIEERAARIKGKLEIDSSPQTGSKISLAIPLPRRYSSIYKSVIKKIFLK